MINTLDIQKHSNYLGGLWFTIRVSPEIETEICIFRGTERYEIRDHLRQPRIELFRSKEISYSKATKEVTLKWIHNSRSELAEKLRKAISLTPDNECVLCAMFFNGYYNDEKCSFSEITEDEIEHFQQILDSSDTRIRTQLDKLPNIKIVSLE